MYDWHYVVIISGPPCVDSLIYLLSMAGTQTCFCLCSLCRKKFFALTISSTCFEREAACLLAKPKSNREIRCCLRKLHARIQTKQMSAFPLQTPFGMHGVLLARKKEGLWVYMRDHKYAGIMAEAWYSCTGTGRAVWSGCLPTQLHLHLRIVQQGWTYNRRYWL